jgi:hypothetical protein
MKCKSGPPTLDGSKSSDTLERTSPTFKTERFLISIKEKTKKDKKLLFGTDITELIKDGESSMLISQRKSLLKDSTPDSVSTSTDNSISDQECQCKELLNALVPTTLFSEDMSREEPLKDSTSTLPARPLSLNNGNTFPWTSNLTEDHQISE